jgi:hypothetical protein
MCSSNDVQWRRKNIEVASNPRKQAKDRADTPSQVERLGFHLIKAKD